MAADTVAWSLPVPRMGLKNARLEIEKIYKIVDGTLYCRIIINQKIYY